MRNRLFVVLSVLMVAMIAFPATTVSAGTPPPSLNTLQPGGFRTIEQNLKINIVFVGYDKGGMPMDVDESTFLDLLPDTYRTVNRYPSFYFGSQFLGLTFDFDYNLVYADSHFENTFFDYLSSIAAPQPLTVYQQAYNDQVNNALDVTENYWISAPAVEQWLADHAEPMLGVDTQQYTIFFVNWYGRDDFKFHVYTKIGEPDPDTGFDFGLNQDSRKLIAWGGTTPDDEETGLGSLQRIWFYDLSAGPEGWTDNWNVDDADLDGNGVMEYRMPPVWEYGNLGAYRPFDNLSGDLGKIARYVAIDLLFTPSPLYKPALSAPDLPQSVQFDINLYGIAPGFDAKTLFNPALISQELGEILPLNSVSTELKDVAFKSKAKDVYYCFISGPSCYGNRLYGINFGDLFLYHSDKLLTFLEGDADYEVPIFAYYDSNPFAAGGLLGFADDDWATGTQSYIFAFDDTALSSLGYGFTATVIHETGHHVGLSHPHDGFDYESNVDFGPGDDFYYAWSGDESNTIMAYTDLNWDFSQFNRDSMNRYMTSIYINQANSLLAKIYASPRAGDVAALLTAADGYAATALTKYATMEYASAASYAKKAYTNVMAAAAKLQIPVEPQSWQADYKAKGSSYMFVDSVNYQRSKP